MQQLSCTASVEAAFFCYKPSQKRRLPCPLLAHRQSPCSMCREAAVACTQCRERWDTGSCAPCQIILTCKVRRWAGNVAVERDEWNRMCQVEGVGFNSSVDGLEEGGDRKTIQLVNDTKFRESTEDKNIFQEDCKIMGWQERKTSLETLTRNQGNTGTHGENLQKNWYQERRGDMRNDEAVMLLTWWVWKLQMKVKYFFPK